VDLESALVVSHGTCTSGRETYLGLGVDQVGKEGELDGPVLSCVVSLIPGMRKVEAYGSSSRGHQG
jgi:hypothetical protein